MLKYCANDPTCWWWVTFTTELSFARILFLRKPSMLLQGVMKVDLFKYLIENSLTRLTGDFYIN